MTSTAIVDRNINLEPLERNDMNNHKHPVVCFLLVTIALACPHRGAAQRASASWTLRIQSGQSFGVLFDALESPVGTIRPQGLYVVTFKPAERSWTASGPMHPDGYQANVTYPGSMVCNPAVNALCIWGAAFGFDDSGQVLIGTTRVGRLQALSLRDRIASGAPVGVLLDALPSNVGTIRPGGQYQVEYRPVERAWKATGPMHPAGFQEHVDPVTSALCDPNGSALCIWGAPFRFDEQGRVMRDGVGVVGRILG